MVLKPEILVVGATGKIGQELIPLLLNADIPLRLMVRTETAKRLFPQGNVEFVQADLNDREAVEKAVQDIATIFLVTRDQPGQGELESALIEAAAYAGVKKIVKSSAFAAGLSPPVGYGVTHAVSEKKLMDSGLRWVILRPYMFMQNFLELAELIGRRGLMPLPMGKAAIALIDARDVALTASRVLTESSYDNSIYELTGPQSLTMQECTAIFSDSLGRTVRYRSPPFWLAGLMMRKEGVSKWDVDMRKQLFRMIRDGGEASISNDVEDITGRKPYSLEQFIHTYLPSFLKTT